MYISHSSKIPSQPRDELQWEEEEENISPGLGSENFQIYSIVSTYSFIPIFFRLCLPSKKKKSDWTPDRPCSLTQFRQKVPGHEVIKLFSCSTQLSTKFILLINVKCQQLLAF